MATTETTTAPITVEQFLQLEQNAPDDVHFELIRGELREYPNMTTRSPNHAEAFSEISHLLISWRNEHPERLGVVAGAEARCRIFMDAETMVGLDVAYFEGKRHVHRPQGQSFFDGPPVLAVEILSPTDTHERMIERIRLMQAAGVKQVWVADPDFRTVTVYRPNAEPVLYAANKEITGEPDLPGFRCRVGRFFSGAR